MDLPKVLKHLFSIYHSGMAPLKGHNLILMDQALNDKFLPTLNQTIGTEENWRHQISPPTFKQQFWYHVSSLSIEELVSLWQNFNVYFLGCIINRFNNFYGYSQVMNWGNNPKIQISLHIFCVWPSIIYILYLSALLYIFVPSVSFQSVMLHCTESNNHGHEINWLCSGEKAEMVKVIKYRGKSFLPNQNWHFFSVVWKP